MDPRRDTHAQPDRRELGPSALGKQGQGQRGDRLCIGATGPSSQVEQAAGRMCCSAGGSGW